MSNLMSRIYDSMVVFSEPIFCGGFDKIYGFLFNSKEHGNNKYSDAYLQLFIEYIVGSAQWSETGGSISKDGCYWLLDGEHYSITSDFVKDFCKQAFSKSHITYTVMEGCCPQYSRKHIKNSYIINEDYKLWKM